MGILGRRQEAAAVKRAIVSILKTNHNERMFQPEFGSNIRALLFEQMNPITEQRMKKEVESAVARHEPRAEVLGITVKAQEEQNRYEVSVLVQRSIRSRTTKINNIF